MKSFLKRFVIGLFVACVIVSSCFIGVGAFDDYEEHCDRDFKYVITENRLSATGYIGNEKVITLPSFLAGRRVESISWLNFTCQPGSTLIVSEGPEIIHSQAFENCSGLQTVILPDSINRISYAAFYGCRNLKTVILPAGLDAVGYVNFCNSTALSSINVPGKVTYIDANAFDGCSSLYSVSLPKSLEKVWDAAFYNCPKLAHVYYEGSESDWKKIAIEKYNESLTRATVHYNHKHTPDKGTLIPATDKSAGTKLYRCTVCKIPVKCDILPMISTGKVTGVTLTNHKSTSVTVNWYSVDNAASYEVSYSAYGKNKWKTATVSSLSHTFKNLRSGAKYKFRVRALVKGKYGPYSDQADTYTAPAKPKISKLKSTKRKTAQVAWKKSTGASGYQIKYSSSKRFSKAKTVSVKKSTKKTLKKLKSRKKYYVRVRAYRVINGEKVYSSWSKTKTVKVR